jgi:predicted Rossmann fold nucleotide-binding protein DprA/Smf involved in DNA uptake
VYSGAARGVDATTMGAAIEAGGAAVGVLADSLERTLGNSEIRAQIDCGALTLLTPYSTRAQFTVGTAMGRNKLIYGLADWGIVVASDAEKGGTWAGAVEALKSGLIPLFVRAGEEVPEGNRLLIKAGAAPFPFPFPQAGSALGDWLEINSRGGRALLEQTRLF